MIEFLFSMFWMSLIFIGHFMSLKSSLFAKYLSAFVSLAGLWSAGCKYQSKYHLKQSLSSLFWILTKPFLGFSNSFGSLI